MFLISRLTYHCKTSLTGTLNIFSELFFINVPDLDGQELYRERLCEIHKHSTACRYFDKKGIEDLWSAIKQVNDHVDTDCKRPGPKPFLGTESEKEIYKPVTELQKVGHGFIHKEILQLAGEINSKRVSQVLKNTLPSKL